MTNGFLIRRSAIHGLPLPPARGLPSRTVTSLVPKRARQHCCDGWNKGYQQKTQKKDSEVFEDRPHRFLEPNAADQAGVVESETERWRKQPDTHADDQD